METLYFLICIGASILGSISGTGGGVIIKPALDAMGTMNVSTISFLSGCTVLGMTSMTLYRNSKAGMKPEKKRGTYLAIGASLGGLLGKQIFDWVKISSGNPQIAGAVQSFVLALVTLGVLIFTIQKSKIKPYNIENIGFSLIIGFFLGALSSFLGIGGGPINLMVLYLFFGLNSKEAAINSIYIIFFSQGISIIQTILKGVPNFVWLSFVMMVAGGLLGGIVGPMVSKRLSLKGVDKIYLCMIVGIILISIYNGINYLGILSVSSPV
ncbi:sulfite exporter TauE/SafE family protein [Cetobacterium sp. 8H]|uniref:sulfite exporter TauE/SafE family protein n=1 Tax=Cetobacterium sp. 8H TaxID=2759681 RepID=UPI00163BC152|nr:sulfite exporter TauE/SafE family protein [Cetobacterium sp. 8H]MBC2850117.1 sulfite exporter TauE/SafE family protein [Cetobacterium sp. 8H]